MVVCQRAGGWCGDGGGAGGDGRLRWGAAELGHGVADAARAGAAWADAWLWGLGRRCVPPGCAGYQAAAGRRGRRGMTGQDQHHRAGEGGGASYRPQRQVRLRPGQCVRPPRVGGSLVPRHVTGTLAHCPITPGAIRARGTTVAAAYRGIAPVRGHMITLAWVPRAGFVAPAASPARSPAATGPGGRRWEVNGGRQQVCGRRSDCSAAISRGWAAVCSVAGLRVAGPARGRCCAKIRSRASGRLPHSLFRCAGRQRPPAAH